MENHVLSSLIMDKWSIIIHFSSLVIFQQVELHLLLLHQFFQPVALEHLGTSWNRHGPDPLGGKPQAMAMASPCICARWGRGDMGNIWEHGWNTYVSHVFTCFSMNMVVSYSTIFRNSLDIINKYVYTSIYIQMYYKYPRTLLIQLQGDHFWSFPLSLSGLHGFWGLLLNSFAGQKLYMGVSENSVPLNPMVNIG